MYLKEELIILKSLFSLTLMLGISYTQTDVSGEVSGTWTLEGSPYKVVGHIDLSLH